ncbi:MAG: hypothetical protein Kow00121_20660 [Elainellaceae cyanobacterium]
MDPSQRSQQAKKHLDDAQQFFLMGIYTITIALQRFEDAIALNSELVEAWEGKAAALRELGMFEESIAASEKAISMRSQAIYTEIGAIQSKSTNEDIETWFEQGNQLFFADDFQGAIASYDRALAADPNYYQIWLGHATALLHLGQHEAAIGSYERALAVKPDCPEVWFSHGSVLLHLGQYEAAITSFDHVLTINPDHHEACFSRGNALNQLGQHEAAIDSFSHALSLKPNYDAAWFGHGIALTELGQHEAALTSYDRALTINPDHFQAWYNRGIVLHSLGQHEAEVASYDRALTINSDYDAAWYNRGNALADLGQHEAEVASYDRALAINPVHDAAWYNRGNALDKLGQYEAAIDSFDRALAINPNYYKVWFGRGSALAELGQYETAINSYDRALAISSDLYPAWNNRGNALDKLGQYEAAIDSFDHALVLKPDACEVWSNRGDALAELGRYEAAINSYDRALAINPDLHKAWNNRGNMFAYLEQHEAAINSYDRALAINPNLYEAWNNRGISLTALEQDEAAIASYDCALAINPNVWESWNDRGNALNNLGRYEAAVNSLNRALAINSDLHEVWSNLGQALAGLGEYEAAIVSFDRALTINSNYYRAWNNRGSALAELGHYEAAIISYDRALAINPDYYQAWDNRGSALAKLGKYKDSIASYDRALAINPDFYEAWNNLGIALAELGQYQESVSNFDQALNLKLDYYHAWNNRGISLHNLGQYEGRLDSIKQGFKYVTEGTEGWGLLYFYLGNAHRDQARRVESPRSLWRDAETSYKVALEILTSEQFPEHHLNVLQDLIGVLSALRETDEAQTLQRQGSDLLRRLLSDPTRSPKQQRSLLSKQSIFDQVSVDIAAQMGDVIKALQLAEHGKNTCLRWMLEINEPPEITYADIQHWLPPTTALLYWHLSPSTITTFVILPGQDRPQLIPAPISLPTPYAPTLQTDEPDQRPTPLKQLLAWENWLKEWNQDYQLYINKENQTQRDYSWRTHMIDRLDAIRQILNISAIEDLLNPHITQLILVPHRDLHRLPLHTFFNLPCTYLPSAYLGLSTQTQANNCERLLLIENPKNEAISLGGGTFIEIESALIQRLFPVQVIESKDATAEQVTSALSQPHQLFHFSGHGAYNSRKPAQSCLYLTGADRLTLITLAHLDLSPYALICLAACETGVTGKQTISDEYVGLPSAFLKAKASRIVSTFWHVEAAATTYFMVEFYRSLSTRNSLDRAFQHAQTFLKTATSQVLIDWIDVWVNGTSPDLPRSIKIALQAEQRRLRRNTIEHPYAHPYYWAAFAISGL